MGLSSHERVTGGGKDEWLTPPHILQALGQFDLDPCAPINRPWEMAKQHYTILDNGLAKEWFGRVWCNPPYGNKTGFWIARLADHGNGIGLIFARTETKMFFDHIWPKATALLFLEGRLSFWHASGNIGKETAGAPSVLVAYGEDNAEQLKLSGLRGKFIRLVEVPNG